LTAHEDGVIERDRERTGSDLGYYYMGSAIWFNRIGRVMGEAMLELMGDVGS